MRSPRSRALERDAAAVEHVELIPGMPDDVAVDCLARVPHGSYRAMRRDADGGSGRHALWVFDVKTKNWTVVRPPPEFAGFAFSVAAVRV
uniref:Uncharacterized protein n=1 Tax=Oryza brachyantha TaxID=4533 RepID=J3N768_ORYBR